MESYRNTYTTETPKKRRGQLHVGEKYTLVYRVILGLLTNAIRDPDIDNCAKGQTVPESGILD